MTKVLIITNDSYLKTFVNLILKYNGFVVHSANSSASAWKLLSEIQFDIIMVDYKLSHESGLAFYKSIRQFGSQTPLLMIGENEFDEFMLKDLSTHNYDYMLKPFKFKDLKVKINGLLNQRENSDKVVWVGHYKVDIKKQMLMVKDKFIELGRIEMKILLLLARKTGETVDPLKLKNLLEADGNFLSMTTFYYIDKLRSKLKHLSDETFEIIFIKNQGYKLEFKA